jgi:hypothetical protein
MTPTDIIVAAAAASKIITDADGRRLTIRRMSALDKLRLFKAAGPVLAQNQPWLGMAMLACSVAAIDDIPIPSPANELQIEGLVSRLNDTGISAVADALRVAAEPNRAELAAIAGN